MSPSTPVSNVYYLTPPAPAVEPRSRRSRGVAVRRRVLAFWWRLRLTAVEVVATVRRFGRAPVDLDTTFLERAELVPGAERRPAGPARIIDFATARTRLRA